MFNNPAQSDSSWDEGSVTEVDSIRKLCKVKTVRGQNLTGVRYMYNSGGASRSGDRQPVTLGDQVVINSGLGYPLIVGFLPRLQTESNVFPLSIDQGETLIDTGNFSEAGKTVIADQNAPKDSVVGDRIIASLGGGLMAILRGGSVLLRSSRLAEIYLSKWDDLVRVVSRNWEHFTDVSSDIVKNINGRIYRYTGYAKLFKDAKVEDYKYHQYIGDVALARVAKTDYIDVTPPSVTDVIYQEEVTTGSGGSSSQVLSREIHLDGTHDLVVKAGGTFTRIKSTSGEVVVTYGDTNVVKINSSEISLKKGGDSKSLVINDSSVTTTFGGAVLVLDSAGVRATFGGHFVDVNSGGVNFG